MEDRPEDNERSAHNIIERSAHNIIERSANMIIPIVPLSSLMCLMLLCATTHISFHGVLGEMVESNVNLSLNSQDICNIDKN